MSQAFVRFLGFQRTEATWVPVSELPAGYATSMLQPPPYVSVRRIAPKQPRQPRGEGVEKSPRAGKGVCDPKGTKRKRSN